MRSPQSRGNHPAAYRKSFLKCSWRTAGAFLLLSIGRFAVGQEAMQSSSAEAAMPIHAADAAPEATHKPQGSNTLAYWFGSTYRTPFVLQPNSFKAADIQRRTLEYTHVDFWKAGSNFADVMLNQSNMAEQAASGGTGATEVYVTLRSDVSLNEITQSRTFRTGPLRDIAIEIGANLETKNSSFAPAERTLYTGPKFQFALPKGFFNVGLHLRKEWNHEGVLGKSEHYDPDFNTEVNWMVPFTLGKMHLAWAGFADHNTPKGKDSFGSKTEGEFLVRSAVSVDAGQFLFRRAQLLDVSGGLWYWRNEYGKPSSDPGARQATPFIGLVYHLDGGRAIRRR
jgi:hypothetical protein